MEVSRCLHSSKKRLRLRRGARFCLVTKLGNYWAPPANINSGIFWLVNENQPTRRALNLNRTFQVTQRVVRYAEFFYTKKEYLC